MPTTRLERQLAFVAELDELKGVLRRTRVTGGVRRENSAEHSWHVATMAALLAEHAPEETDLLRTIRMLLVHDVVEIDAGDTFCFDPDATAHADKAERERRAAERIFAILPPDQAADLRALWDEFEAGETAEARFAVALDRLQGVLQNHRDRGGTWRIHSVPLEHILVRVEPIREGFPALWEFVRGVLDDAIGAGWVEGERAALDRDGKAGG